MRNIALIGMPGSGKSIIGKRLSRRLHMNFLDVDTYIEQHHGSIEDLFARGEDHFRNIEESALSACVMQSNTVISTGGGVVEREANRELLRLWTTVVFIDRPLEHILGDIQEGKRPLLKNNPGKLPELYRRRIGKYREWADHTVGNDRTPGIAIEEIIRLMSTNNP
ncbi:MAG: shikimate kinase [Clostridia bacterium]